MRNRLSPPHPWSRTRGHAPSILLLAVLSALALSSACYRRDGEGDRARGVIIVNAPAAGEVRRVLASEGVAVREGDAVIEIVVRAGATVPQPARTEDPVASAGRNIAAAQSEIEAARAAVVRAEVEVQRLTPLVAAGQSSQGELDGARASYDQAQQRLRQAQTAEQGAQAGLVAARQPARTATPAPAPSEQVVYARATSAGTMSAVSARVGTHVVAGQPLATIRANQ